MRTYGISATVVISSLVVIGGLFAVISNIYGYEEKDLDTLLKTNSCIGCDLSKADLSSADLKKADLSGAMLTAADLSDAMLTKANLSKADLRNATLSRATLERANLADADLADADISMGDLTGADLSGAFLTKANLSGAGLEKADLTDGILTETILALAQMKDAKLRSATLNKTDLSRAKLEGATLHSVKLLNANLRFASLCKADLTKGSLFKADFSEATLTEAILKEAKLTGAILVRANLTKADLSGADLNHVDLTGAILPVDLEKLRDVNGWSTVYWQQLPRGIIAIRNNFRKEGMGKQASELTYAIRRSARRSSGFIESIFNYIMFEISCCYGMKPGRPLKILLVLIVLFSFPYMGAVVGSEERKSGIWRVWPKEPVQEKERENMPSLVRVRGYRIPIWAFYFSFVSAFNIGWRDLNLGYWFARVHPKEYELRSTGWVKVISGFQALISVYLIALWVLTFFGTPFE